MTPPRPTLPATPAQRTPAGGTDPRRWALGGALGALLWCVYPIAMFGVISSGGFGEPTESSLHTLFVISTVLALIVVLALVSINVVTYSCSGTHVAPSELVRSAAVLSRFCVARLVLTVVALIAVVVLVGSSQRSTRFDYLVVACFTVLDCLVTLALATFARGAVRRLGVAPAR